MLTSGPGWSFSAQNLPGVPQGQLSNGRVTHPDPKPLVTKQGRELKALMLEHVSSAL